MHRPIWKLLGCQNIECDWKQFLCWMRLGELLTVCHIHPRKCARTHKTTSTRRDDVHKYLYTDFLAIKHSCEHNRSSRFLATDVYPHTSSHILKFYSVLMSVWFRGCVRTRSSCEECWTCVLCLWLFVCEEVYISVHRRVQALGSRVAKALDSQLAGCEFNSRPRRCRVTIVGKLLTPACLSRSQWFSDGMIDCGVRGRGQLCLSRQPQRCTSLGTGCAPFLQCLGRLSLPPSVGR